MAIVESGATALVEVVRVEAGVAVVVERRVVGCGVEVGHGHGGVGHGERQRRQAALDGERAGVEAEDLFALHVIFLLREEGRRTGPSGVGLGLDVVLVVVEGLEDDRVDVGYVCGGGEVEFVDAVLLNEQIGTQRLQIPQVAYSLVVVPLLVLVGFFRSSCGRGGGCVRGAEQ